jgi:tetratricopeptide (TPR) repeat protein
MNIFHRLFVEIEEDSLDDDLEPIEDILAKIQKTFEDYNLDSIYHHLKIIFEFLKLEYYNHYRVYRKAEKYFEEVNEDTALLLSNYNLYTYPSQFLISKIERHKRLKLEDEMYEENEGIFFDFEVDKNDIPQYVTYMVYRALSCYYVKKYDEAARWINNLLNEVSLKRYPNTQLEIKVILALQYCLLNDYDLFNQLINSIQRQIRIIGKENCEHLMIFTKILKVSISELKKNKEEKIRALIKKFSMFQKQGFSPSMYIKMDDEFAAKLS